MKSLEERKRDIFFNEHDYNTYLKIAEGIFQQQQLEKPELKTFHNISLRRLKSIVEDFWMRYSAGDSLDELNKRLRDVFKDIKRHRASFPDHKLMMRDAGSYHLALTLLSWTVLFNQPDSVELTDDLKVLTGFMNPMPDGGQDPLIMFFLSKLGTLNTSVEESSLIHTDPYKIIYDARQEAKTVQEAAVIKYLRNWYLSESIQDCYWHDRHKRQSPNPHLGYWAFETGLLTIINDLDDSSYRQLNFYPKDLVDYWREQVCR